MMFKQPYYILVDHKETNLNDPIGYTPDDNEYLKWIQEGIQNYAKK